MLDFEYLNVFFGKLKFKKMPKFETLSALRGLILKCTKLISKCLIFFCSYVVVNSLNSGRT